MDKIFLFGESIGDNNFIGREAEIKRLKANFTHGINTMLISPRRWGKTSLVKKVAKEVKSDKLKVVFLDIFWCRSEYDFYNVFAEAVLRQTASRFEEFVDTATSFLGRIVSRVALSPDPNSEISLSLGITPKTHTPEEILELPERIAAKKKCHIVVCIDEFQQIGEFEKSLSVQKRMRSVWQHQQNTSYCLFGSKKHLLENIFQSRSNPFYKFGDIAPLDPIPVETWIPYITKGFAKENKKISEDFCKRICEIVKYNPSYVQQLSWLTLLNTDKEVTEDIFKRSVDDLIKENTQLFLQQTESLTSYQTNFLRALLDGVSKDFGIKEIRETYSLGTYSNIARIKTALTDKELIDFDTSGTFIADPVLELWLKKIL
ncbi:MAG: ATP-binding protein [Bacteroidales bacterium]|nr:ATP-binding protein [Bacteroidales bacterium]